ncbi:ATP phosphoribosyltransferase regulatory subunit [Kroppenstedtia sanguinis]|uniref:ATP phosphoribosyltransferase regulatory subunit n=1 Tax=Kroppenstedtia sanguinis TaxID=1380684 RepID=A0ABW4C9Q1_9BACL
MPKPRQFEKPMGVRDFPPEFVSGKRWVEKQVEDRFSAWGYREVMTPTLEYFDTVGMASAIAEQKLFKLLDSQGQTLVLRPDQTAPIARVVSSVLREEPLPIRLSYHAGVYRSQEWEAGRNAEFFQSGVELVGDSSPEADAEVIALAVECLQACGVENIQVSLGHIGLLDARLLEELGEPEMMADLKKSLGRRNLVQFREKVRTSELSTCRQQRLLALLSLRGEREVLQRLQRESQGTESAAAIAHLEAMWDALEDWGVASHVMFDLSLTGSLDYYTGMYFEGYGADGSYLLSGGRYDRLMALFGRPAPARGFALKTDRLVMACPPRPDSREAVALVCPRRLHREACQQAQELRRQGHRVTLLIAESGFSPEKRAGFDQVVEVREEDGDG